MDHRSKIFAKLKKFNSGLIGKSALLDFLIVNPSVMLLYNISPLRLGLELENYDTDRPGAMSFKEFSTFLFMHRETNDPNDFYRGLQLVRANRNYHRSVVEAREYVGGAEVR
jgi:Ca2+-binding EF-hand superfamily protein